jgi:hypothetical protein
MANHSNHLFIRKVASKSSAERITVIHDDRFSIFPADTFGAWKQIFQQFILRRPIDGDRSMADSWLSTISTSEAVPVTAEMFQGSTFSLHFDVTVHGLRCGTLHDDMNRNSDSGIDHVGLSITTEEVGNLLFGGSIRDLKGVSEVIEF